jgi:hypothetical protein
MTLYETNLLKKPEKDVVGFRYFVSMIVYCLRLEINPILNEILFNTKYLISKLVIFGKFRLPKNNYY